MGDISVIFKRKKRFCSQTLKILVFRPITSSFFGGPFMLQGAIEAFRRIGHEVDTIDLKGCGPTSEERLKVLVQEIAGLQPDFVFTLNFIGFVPILTELMERLETPFVTWFVDSPFHYLKRGGTNSRYCVVFTCDRAYTARLKDMGFVNIFFLPGAADPKIFRKIELDERDREQFSCNISFVGTSHANSYRRYCQVTKDGNAQMVLSRVVQMQIENLALDISSILEEAKKLLPPTVSFKGSRRSLELLLEEAAMAIYRKEIIESVVGFKLHLYGDDGWRSLLDNKVKIFNQLDYYTELPKLYSASKINLNITLSGLKSAINQRVFDVSACGGFVLSDYRRDLSELFSVGEEVLCYRNKEELTELIEYFLKHPKERKEIANRAQARILEEHTYEHRMNQAIEVLRGLYK